MVPNADIHYQPLFLTPDTDEASIVLSLEIFDFFFSQDKIPLLYSIACMGAPSVNKSDHDNLPHFHA
jgi:hypothetical protein